MARLQFDTLEVEHFRCFTAKQTFALAPSPGLWFLRGKNAVEPQLGSNGAGKSSVFEALCWVLNAQTSQKLKNTDIRPWKGKGTPRATLKLQVDGQRRTISREAKTNGLSIDGQGVGPEEAAKLIGLPFEVFINTIFFAQDNPLFFDRTPGEKFKLLTEVLPLERWEERSARAAQRAKQLETLGAELTGEIAGLDAALEQTAQLLEQTQEGSQVWEEERQSRTKGMASEIAQLQKQYETQGDRLADVDLKHDGAWIKLREMRADLGKLQKDAETARHALSGAKLELASDERRAAQLRTELKALGEKDTCPVCGQKVIGTQFGKHKAELKKRLYAVEVRIEEGVPKRIENDSEVTATALANFEATLTVAEMDTDRLQSQLNMLKPTVERLKAQLAAVKSAQKERTEERNPYIDQLQGLRRQKAKLETQKEELQTDLLRAQKQIERTRFWVKGFKDVALHLIEEALQEVQGVTNGLLGEVGLVGWGVRYDIERETKSATVQRGINLTITPPYGYTGGPVASIKWESWSGGEGQRLRIIGALALSEVLLRHAGVETNLEVLDEPGKYMSGAGMADLCAYLSERAKNQEKTVWLVDHLVREGLVFSGTAAVTKTPAGSVISTRRER